MRKEGSIGPDVMKATMDAVVAQYAALMPDIYKVTIAEFSEVGEHAGGLLQSPF